MLRRVKGGAEQAIISFSYEAPVSRHLACHLHARDRPNAQASQWRPFRQLHVGRRREETIDMPCRYPPVYSAGIGSKIGTATGVLPIAIGREREATTMAVTL